MADFAALQVSLELQTAAFNKGITSANKSMDRLGKKTKGLGRQFNQLGKNMSGALKGLVAFAGVSFSASFLKGLISANSEMAKMADQTGIGIEAYQELGYAAERAGISTQQYNSNMTAFVKRVGEARNGVGPLVSGLKNLDQALLDSLKGSKSQEEALGILADSMKDSTSATEQAAIANAAFGRSGVAMVNMLGNGSKGLNDMAVQARQLGLVLNEDLVRSAEDFDDSLLDIEKRMKATFGRALLTSITTVMENTSKVLWSFFAAIDKGWNHMVVGAKMAWVYIKLAFEIGVEQALQPIRKLGQLGGDWNPFSNLAESIDESGAASKRADAELKKLSQGLKDYKSGVDEIVLAHFAEVDAQQAATKEYKRTQRERRRLLNSGALIPPETLDPIDDIIDKMTEFERALKYGEDSLEGLRVSALNAQYDINLLNDKMAVLQKLLDSGSISQDVFDKMKKGIIETKEAMADLDETSNLMAEGLQELSEGAIVDLATGFLDANKNWKDFALSFLNDIAEMIIQTQVLNSLQQSSWFTGLFSAGSGSAGAAGSPGISGFSASADIIATAGAGNIALSGGADTTVNVYNNSASTADVIETKDAQGNKTIDVIIKEKVNAAMKAGGLDKQMSSNFGLQRVGV